LFFFAVQFMISACGGGGKGLSIDYCLLIIVY